MIDRFLRRLSVRTRIVGGFVIVIVLLTVSLPVSLANYSFLVGRLRQVTNVEATANRALLLASTRIANSRVNLMRYVDNQVPSPTEALDDADTAIALLADTLEQGLISEVARQQDVTIVMQALAEYRTLITDIETKRRQDPGQENARQIFQAYRLGNDSGQRIEQIVKDSEDRITATNALVEADAQGRLWFLTGSYLVALLLGLTLTLLIQRSITRPVADLRNAAEDFRQGQFDATIAVTGNDELSVLAGTFNQMAAELSHLYLDLEQRVAARTRQLNVSAEVSRAATSILSLEELLAQVAELITTRFGFYYTGVFTLDATNQHAVLRAATGEAGQVLLARGHHLPVDEKSMVGTAILTRGPRIALDVGEGAVRFANPLLPNTRSEIALPLRVGDRVLGALDVQSEQPGAFDEASTAVLQSMADQIAVALSNAEAFQRSERQASVMALLNELSRTLVTATSLEDVALITVPIMASLLGESRIAVAQTTANPHILSLREFTANSQQPVSDSAPIPMASSLLGECLARGTTIYLADLSTATEQYSDVAGFYRQGVRAGITLPLRVGERVLGAFTVGADHTHAYAAEQINQLEQIAAQLAVTIENLNLAEQTQQTLAELNVANRQLVGQAWDKFARTSQLTAAEWRDGTWSVQDSLAGRESTQQALIPAAAPLTLPIRVRGTTIGEFHITTTDAHTAWDEDDTTFAQALIDQVGQVLETARLLDETERTALREKAVANAADKIHRSTDIDSVLQSAVTELQRITRRRGISVQLGFGQTTPPGRRAPNGDTGGER